MQRTPRHGRFSGAGRLLRDESGRVVLLLDPRRRRHLAVLSVMLLVSVFGFVLLQPRKVRVQADGREIEVQTRESSDTALLQGLGVEVRPGDRLTTLISPGMDVLRVERARDVTLRADGITYRVRTHATTIDQLLSEANVGIAGRDSVLQNGNLVSSNAPVVPPRLFATRAMSGADATGGDGGVEIEVRRAVTFTVDEDGRAFVSTTSRPTVAQALREAGVTVGPGDAVSPDPQAPLEADVRVQVTHAKAVTVALPDSHRVLYTQARTVRGALDAAGIVVPAGAFTEPSLDTEIAAGMTVRLVQLSAESDVEREYIESKTVYQSDPSLGPGETRTVQGHDGVRVRRYDVSYVDGQEVGRELVEEYFDPEPVDTVVYYPVQNGRDEAAPAAGLRTLRVYATWYNPASSGRSASDPAYGRTATGVQVTYGVVAVDPSVIPLGTKLFIPGYGYAVAADTGGAVQGYVIDLGYPDGVAVDWISKWVDIEILE